LEGETEGKRNSQESPGPVGRGRERGKWKVNRTLSRKKKKKGAAMSLMVTCINKSLRRDTLLPLKLEEGDNNYRGTQ